MINNKKLISLFYVMLSYSAVHSNNAPTLFKHYTDPVACNSVPLAEGDPEWIILKKGVNIRAVCSSPDCDSNKDEKYGSDDKVKRVLMHYENFILSFDGRCMRCPVCTKEITSKDVSYVIMYKCSYSVVGYLVTDSKQEMKKKIDTLEDFKTEEYNKDGSTTEENNLVRLFDSDDQLVYWASLILKVKNLL